MVKMCDLKPKERTSLINDVSLIMDKYYHIDHESITEFWQTLAIGIKVRGIA